MANITNDILNYPAFYITYYVGGTATYFGYYSNNGISGDGSKQIDINGNCTITFSSDDKINSATITQEYNSNEWVLTVNPKADIMGINFPWQLNKHTMMTEAEEYVYFPYISGIRKSATEIGDYSNTGWQYDGGVAFAPVEIATNESTFARMIYASNWRPKQCTPTNSKQRMNIAYYGKSLWSSGISYLSDTIVRYASSGNFYKSKEDHESSSTSEPENGVLWQNFWEIVTDLGDVYHPLSTEKEYRYIIKDYETTNITEVPWTHLIDDYREWITDRLEAEGVPFNNTPLWMKSDDAVINIQLQNTPDSGYPNGLNGQWEYVSYENITANSCFFYRDTLYFCYIDNNNTDCSSSFNQYINSISVNNHLYIRFQDKVGRLAILEISSVSKVTIETLDYLKINTIDQWIFGDAEIDELDIVSISFWEEDSTSGLTTLFETTFPSVWNMWKDYTTFVCCWGQMSVYYGEGDPYGCCDITDPPQLNQRYFPYWHNFLDTIYSENGHLAVYARATNYPLDDYGESGSNFEVFKEWVDFNALGVDDPSYIDGCGANAGYWDVFGSAKMGDRIQVYKDVEQYMPTDLFMESWKDVTPYPSLISGCLIIEGSFPEFGRYLFNERACFTGFSNNEYTLWGPANNNISERKAFLLGSKFDLACLTYIQDFHTYALSVAAERKRVGWWDRDPIFMHTRGLSDIPDGINISRFIDKNGENLYCIDNYGYINNPSLYNPSDGQPEIEFRIDGVLSRLIGVDTSSEIIIAEEDNIQQIVYSGNSTLMGMEIHYSKCEDNSFEVITTGCRLVYDGTKIDIYQGLSTESTPLPGDKELIASYLGSLTNLSIDEYTSDHVYIYSDSLYIRIFGDSTIIFKCKESQEFNIVGHFVPEYNGIARESYYHNQNIAEIYCVKENKTGGIQISPERYDVGDGYIVQDIYSNSDPSSFGVGISPSSVGDSSFYDAEWGVSYYFEEGQRCSINIFPTKKLDFDNLFDGNASFVYIYPWLEDQILDPSIVDDRYDYIIPSDIDAPPFPTNANLDTIKSKGGIIVLWGDIYDNSSSYAANDIPPQYNYWDIRYLHVVESLKESVIDFIQRAHAKDLKVIFYTSPFYHYLAWGDRNEYYNEVVALKNEFNIDGVYIDGTPCDFVVYNKYGSSYIEEWSLLRRLRELFGKEGVIYWHATQLAIYFRDYNGILGDVSDNIHTTSNIAALSYSTVSWKGEGVYITDLDDYYMKYHVSQYGLSNAYSNTFYGDQMIVPDNDISVWLAQNYGVIGVAWAYADLHEGAGWLWYETDMGWNTVYRNEIENIESPYPDSVYTKISNGETFSLENPSYLSVEKLEINLYDSEECYFTIDDRSYVISKDGNNLIFGEGSDEISLNLYEQNEWTYPTEDDYNISLKWKGYSSNLLDVEIEDAIIEKLRLLSPAPFYIHSWGMYTHEFNNYYDNDYLYEYARISHSLGIFGTIEYLPYLQDFINKCVQICKRVNDNKSQGDLESVICLNFSPFHFVWVAYNNEHPSSPLSPDDTTTIYDVVGHYGEYVGLTVHEAEIRYLEDGLKRVLSCLDNANSTYNANIRIGAFFLDSELFWDYDRTQSQKDGLRAKHDEVQRRFAALMEEHNNPSNDNPSSTIYEVDGIDFIWYLRAGRLYSWPSSYSTGFDDYYTAPTHEPDEKSKLAGTELYLPYWEEMQDGAMASTSHYIETDPTETVDTDKIIPTIALCAGYVFKPFLELQGRYTFHSYLDYNIEKSYNLGRKVAGGNVNYSKVYAVCFFPSPFSQYYDNKELATYYGKIDWEEQTYQVFDLEEDPSNFVIPENDWIDHFLEFARGINEQNLVSVYVISSLDRYLKTDLNITGSSSANIKLGKNETRAFQFVVNNLTKNAVNNVHIEVLGFNETSINAPELILYREHYVNITEQTYSQYSDKKNPSVPTGLYPDALIPFINPYTDQEITSATYLAQDYNVEPQSNQAYWVDVKVGSDVPNGVYTTEIIITINGVEANRIPVIITVFEYTMPSTTRYKKVFTPISPDSRYQFGTISDNEWDIIKDNFHNMLYEHNIPPFTYIVIANSTGNSAYDFWTHSSSYDHITEAYEFFNNAKSDVCYFDILWAGGTNYWGIDSGWNETDFNNATTATNRRNYLEACEELIGLQQGNWIKNPIFWVDEPNTKAQYDGIIQYYTEIKTYAPSFKLVVTGVPPDNDLYWMSESFPSLIGSVDIWCPVFENIWAPAGRPNIQDRLNDTDRDDEIWSYTTLLQAALYYDDSEFTATYGNWKVGYCNWHTDAPLVHYLAPSWVNYNLGITGILYWTETCYQEGLNTNPWTNPITYVTSYNYNGEGMLFYPGDKCGVPEGFVPSIRAKILRESHDDYKYFELLEEKIGVESAKEIISDLVNITNFFDYSQINEQYLNAREAIQNQIVETVLDAKKEAVCWDYYNPVVVENSIGEKQESLSIEKYLGTDGVFLYIIENTCNLTSIVFKDISSNRWLKLKDYKIDSLIVATEDDFTEATDPLIKNTILKDNVKFFNFMYSLTNQEGKTVYPKNKTQFTVGNKNNNLPVWAYLSPVTVGYSDMAYYDNQNYYPPEYFVTELTSEEVEEIKEKYGQGYYVQVGILEEADIRKLHEELIISYPEWYTYGTELYLGIGKEEENPSNTDYGDFYYFNENSPSENISYSEVPSGDNAYRPLPDSEILDYQQGKTIFLPIYYSNSLTWYMRRFYLNFNNPTVREWAKRISLHKMDYLNTNLVYMDGASIPTRVIYDNGSVTEELLPYYSGDTYQEKTQILSDYYVLIYKSIKNSKPKTKICLNFFRDKSGFEYVNRDNLYLEENRWCWDAWMCENLFYNDTYYNNVEYYRTWILNLKSIGKDFWFNASEYSDAFGEYDSDLSNAIWHYVNLIAEDNVYFSIQQDYITETTDKKFYHYSIGYPISDPVLNGEIWTREFETGRIIVNTNPTLPDPSQQHQTSPKFVEGVTFENGNLLKNINCDFRDGTTGWINDSPSSTNFDVRSDDNGNNYLHIVHQYAQPETTGYVYYYFSGVSMVPGNTYILRAKIRTTSKNRQSIVLINTTKWQYLMKGNILGQEEEWYDTALMFKVPYKYPSDPANYLQGLNDELIEFDSTDSYGVWLSSSWPYNDVMSLEIFEYNRMTSIKDDSFCLSFDEHGDVNDSGIEYGNSNCSNQDDWGPISFDTLNPNENISDNPSGEIVYYREIQPSTYVYFKFPIYLFEDNSSCTNPSSQGDIVDSYDYPLDDYILEIGYKDDFYYSDKPYIPLIESELNYYAQNDGGTLDNTFVWGDTAPPYSDKQWLRFAGLSNTEGDSTWGTTFSGYGWRTKRIPLRKNRFQIIRKNSDGYFSFRILTGVNALKISHIALKKEINREKSEFIVEQCRYINCGGKVYDNINLKPEEILNTDNNICVPFNRDINHEIVKGTVPYQNELIGCDLSNIDISIISSKGELTPIYIGVYSLVGVKNLKVSVSDFTCGSDTISSSEIEIFEINCDYKRNFYLQSLLPIYSIQEDRLEKRNYIDIDENSSKRIAIKVKIPTICNGSIYHGFITLEKGSFSKVINIDLSISNFITDQPTDVIRAFYHDPHARVYHYKTSEVYKFFEEIKESPVLYLYFDLTGFFNVSNKTFDLTKFEVRLLDYINTNVINVSRSSSDEKLKIVLQVEDVYYFIDNLPHWTAGKSFYQTYPELWADLSHPSVDDSMESFYNELKRLQNLYNIEFIILIGDEPGVNQGPRIICDRAYTHAHNNGFKTICTYYDTCDTSLVPVTFVVPNNIIPPLTDLVDYKSWAPNTLNDYPLTHHRDPSSYFGYYGFYDTYISQIRKPTYNRFFHGIYMFGSDAKVILGYATGDIVGDIYEDIDRVNTNYPDFILAYPSNIGDDEYIHTMSAEGIREGAKDLDYLYTLQNKINQYPLLSSSLEAQTFINNIKNSIYGDVWHYNLKPAWDGAYTDILSDVSIASGENPSSNTSVEAVDYEAFSRTRDTVINYIDQILKQELIDFYVSNDGNDDNDGRSKLFPWATIERVNTAILNGDIIPGSTIHFRYGDTFVGSLNLSGISGEVSGEEGSPITFTAYEDEDISANDPSSIEKPIITGKIALGNNWEDIGENVWRYDVSSFSSQKIRYLLLNNNNLAMAKLYNGSNGYDRYADINSGDTESFIDSELIQNPSSEFDGVYVGSEILLRSTSYRWDIRTVSEYDSVIGKIVFTPPLPFYLPFGTIGGSVGGYILQNSLYILQENAVENEWVHDGDYIYFYSASNPYVLGTIEISTIDILVNIEDSQNIIISNLKFEYSNMYAIFGGNSNYKQITNCEFERCNVGIIENDKASIGSIIDGNRLTDVGGVGIQQYMPVDLTVSNNTLDNIGIEIGRMPYSDIEGLAGAGTLWYSAIYCYQPSGCLFEYNNITNIGYNGFNINFDSSPPEHGNIVRYNYVENPCLLLVDGGSFYSYSESQSDTVTSKVDQITYQNNIALYTANDNNDYLIGYENSGYAWICNGFMKDGYLRSVNYYYNFSLGFGTPVRIGISEFHEWKNNICVTNHTKDGKTPDPSGVVFSYSKVPGNNQYFKNNIIESNVFINNSPTNGYLGLGYNASLEYSANNYFDYNKYLTPFTVNPLLASYFYMTDLQSYLTIDEWKGKDATGYHENNDRFIFSISGFTSGEKDKFVWYAVNPSKETVDVEFEEGYRYYTVDGDIVESDTLEQYQGKVYYRTIDEGMPQASNVWVTVINGVCTGSYSYSHEEGNNESNSTYQWYSSIDGTVEARVPIAGANSLTYEIADPSDAQYLIFGVIPKSATGSGSLRTGVERFAVEVENPSVENPSVENPSVENPSEENPSEDSYIYYVSYDESFEIDEDKIYTIIINGYSFLVGGKNNKFTWDINGDREYSFLYDDETIYRNVGGVCFSVIYRGRGSYLFDIDLLDFAWYKNVSDLISSSQDRGQSMKDHLDNMTTALSNSEIIEESIDRQKVEGAIEVTLETIGENHVAYSNYLKDFVFTLQEYMSSHYSSINDFLNDTGIKVLPTFAEISEFVGYPINSSNIENIS